jgi:hypothetical protein
MSKANERNKSSGRPTARDVPFVRGAGTDSEPSPRGVRPAQLPRDPTYEAELAEVELAVLRNPRPREDASTKQGGRLAQQATLRPPPESVTPESPLARPPEVQARRSQPPSSVGRAAGSGTLLSVGAVDPRGKTERTLETPRMFFSQQGSEAYFKPGKIPAVTVQPTLEAETVKLSDSIDPRRAKTIPRLDRAALARLASGEQESGPETPPLSDQPLSDQPLSDEQSSFDSAGGAAEPSYPLSPRWSRSAWQQEGDDQPIASDHDGQIHASLSPFREQAESAVSVDAVPTRPEPMAARQASLGVGAHSASPVTAAVPTHRDLPAHRLEASQPPPPERAVESAPVPTPAVAPPSESPTAPSDASEPAPPATAAAEPELRAAWINYLAFALALLFALFIGLYVTRGPDEPTPPSTPSRLPVDAAAPELVAPPSPPSSPAPPPLREHAPSVAKERSSEEAPPAAELAAPPRAAGSSPRSPSAPVPTGGAQRKPPVNHAASRETIF